MRDANIEDPQKDDREDLCQGDGGRLHDRPEVAEVGDSSGSDSEGGRPGQLLGDSEVSPEDAQAKSRKKKAQKGEPKQRRPGQIIRRGKDKYLIRIFTGKDSTGKRHYFNETFHGRKAQADDRLLELLTKLKTGEPLKLDNDTLNAFLDEWLRSHPDLKESSVHHYERMMALYVRPKLGKLMLARITADNIQKLYEELGEGGLAPYTIAHVHTILKMAFRLAALRRRIAWNPMEGVKSPSGKKLTAEQKRNRESRVMTPEQAQEFLAKAEETRFGAVFTLAIHTGCRPGELLGLQWGDVDAQAKLIKIRRNIKWRVGGEWYLDDPKTEAGKRTLRIDAGIVERLARHRETQDEEKAKAGRMWEDHGFIFCDDHGRPYSQNHLRYYCKKILASAGLPFQFNPYSARHSNATWMIESGINAKTVAARLGHSDVKITLGVYTHSTEGMDTEAAAVVANLMEESKGEP